MHPLNAIVPKTEREIIEFIVACQLILTKKVRNKPSQKYND